MTTSTEQIMDFTDDDLVLLHYGELDAARSAALRAAIARDPVLAARRSALEHTRAQVGAAPQPVADAALGARMWDRVQPRLGAQQPAFGPTRWAPWLALAASVAAVAVGVRLWTTAPAGVVVPPAAGMVADAAFTPAARERVLLTRVAHHLDGSQRLFTSVSNTESSQSDLGEVRSWAQRALAANRVYRSAASAAGEKRMVVLLDAMEPLLIEIANAPESITREELAFLQQRIDDADLVFRLRSAQKRIEIRANQGAATAVQPIPRSDI